MWTKFRETKDLPLWLPPPQSQGSSLMALKLYMDHHVPRAITIGLRIHGVDVITSHEDAAGNLADSALLDRAGKLGRVLFTRDDDLVVEAVRRHKSGIERDGGGSECFFHSGCATYLMYCRPYCSIDSGGKSS